MLETNENEHTTVQNQWDTVKAVLREKFIVIQAYLKTTGHSKGSPEKEAHSNTGIPKEDRKISINNLTLHLKELEEQQQTNPRAKRRKEIRSEQN